MGIQNASSIVRARRFGTNRNGRLLQKESIGTTHREGVDLWAIHLFQMRN